MSAPVKNVVVLGAGVVGLTIAYVLATSPEAESYKIKIVARDMPEDLDSQAFASPWAGANWSPMRGFNKDTLRREIATFNKFWDMIPTGLTRALPSRVYYDDDSDLANLWYKTLVRDFRVLEPSEVPKGAKGGVSFKTFSVNPEVYLPWLKQQLQQRGVEFIRKRMHSLGQAAAIVGAGGVLVNATALGARSLIGVEDKDVYPIRGQTIIVNAPAVDEFLSFPLGRPSADGDATYIIPRPSPTGHVLLGGTYQEGSWDTSLDFSSAQGIFERCAALAPALRDKETRILSHNVGLRPARKNGARIEVEWLDGSHKSELLPASAGPDGRVLIVHAYGFGPAGYQNSWGAAEEVVALIKGNFSKL
ncbi:FAD dependent oxidoreductase [Sparassis latifolia]|uniref:D-amino-acid oxidase n=1 Tax=Sparassis crispa TaxID=139825 RepID=A0A401GRU2_9APHY|nr:D-amino-acid oxidase [Sparassis crispa]GBE84952.1 D-amino-acid oxidase [Sparassis crispa]